MWRKKDRNREAFEKVKRTVVSGAVENGGQAPGSFAPLTDCLGKTSVTKTESAPEFLWMTPPDTRQPTRLFADSVAAARKVQRPPGEISRRFGMPDPIPRTEL